MESQDSTRNTKRLYILAASLLLFGVGVSVIGYLVTNVKIPQADVTTLGLSGKLILARGMGSEMISRMDLTTGEIVPLFLSERSGGIVTSAAASPDASTLALAYAPPPEGGVIQFGYTDLYTMPADGSMEPTLVLNAPEPDVVFSPRWSADGAFLYYVRSHVPAGDVVPELSIERIPAAGGEPEVIVPHGSGPALSSDGAHLVYIATVQDGTVDELYLANAEGSDAHPVTGSEVFRAVNNPIFSPDGTSILFSGDQSAFTPTPAAQTNPFREWVASLWGVQIASAHSTSTSDIWRVPVEGGKAERVARVADEGILIDFSPDGAYATFTTTRGLHVMRADGKNLVQIGQAGDFLSVQWVP